MNKTLANRVNKIMEIMGDPADINARVRAMSDDELNAAIRETMIANGYDPALPHGEALAVYIAKLGAEAETKQLVSVLREQADILPRLFPESPADPMSGVAKNVPNTETAA